MSEIYVLACDLHHRGKYLCRNGMESFCARFSLDVESLVAGCYTAEELEATEQHLALEAARNARERVAREEEQAEAEMQEGC